MVEAETAPLVSKIRTYHQLPPDFELACLKIEQVRAELLRVEEQVGLREPNPRSTVVFCLCAAVFSACSAHARSVIRIVQCSLRRALRTV
jgi:hypothetical protein